MASDPTDSAPPRDARVDAGSGGVEPASQPRASLSLLGTFELRCGDAHIDLALPAQRVLAFVALQQRPVHRNYAAETLWLHASPEHAYGSLRSALWQISRLGCDVIRIEDRRLNLAPGVTVDALELIGWAAAVLRGSRSLDADSQARPPSGELLLDWYDDWLIVERERVSELHIHALERLCDRLVEARRFAEAIEVGLEAVRAEPLRESARRCVISVHLAEGNHAKALQEFEGFRLMLRDRVGLEPTVGMYELVRRLDPAASPVVPLVRAHPRRPPPAATLPSRRA